LCQQRAVYWVAAAGETTAAYVGAASLLHGKKDGSNRSCDNCDQASKLVNGVRFHARHDDLLQTQKLVHTVCQANRYCCEAAGSTRVLALPLLSIILAPQRLLDCIELSALLSAYLTERVGHRSLPVLIQNCNPVDTPTCTRICIDNHAAATSACNLWQDVSRVDTSPLNAKHLLAHVLQL
jgi:hypothetical protein